MKFAEFAATVNALVETRHGRLRAPPFFHPSARAPKLISHICALSGGDVAFFFSHSGVEGVSVRERRERERKRVRNDEKVGKRWAP